MQPMSDTAARVEVRARAAGQRRWGILFAVVWLVYLAYPLSDLLTGRHPMWVLALALGLTGVFAALYAVGLYLAFAGRRRRTVQAIPLALLAITAALTPVMGGDSASYLVFATAMLVMAWPVRVSVPVVLATVAWAAYLPVLMDDGAPATFLAFQAAFVGAFMYGVRRMRRQGEELGRAQEELARLAVVDERARFARDLHDILGHSLTTIAVKAELAGRLIERSPERAGVEVADIERLAREALADVRHTVSGYREVTLAAELAAARSVLAAAGIRADLPQAVDAVPGDLREVFGWAVREGVTNVVRHSDAHACVVRLTPTSVEVVDDGRGGPATAGHGLSGLRERVAAAGGRLHAGPGVDGGFRLRAEVPTGPAGMPSSAGSRVA